MSDNTQTLEPTLEQQIDADCKAALQRAKPVTDLLDEYFTKQFDRLFPTEK